MTPAEAAAFRLGLEAGAKAAERGRLVPDCYDHGRSTVVVDMAADEIAAAIRALPVPEGGEVEDGETQLNWVKSEIIGLCEATEDDPSLMAAASSDEEGKQGAYARGRMHEAKGIRRAMAEVIRDRLVTLRAARGQP